MLCWCSFYNSQTIPALEPLLKDTSEVDSEKRIKQRKGEVLNDSVNNKLELIGSEVMTKKRLDSLAIKSKLSSHSKLAKSILNERLDSLKKQKKLLQKSKIVFKGSITNEFDYGAIPYYLANQSLPASLYKSTGNLKLKLGKLPLLADYFYANPKFITGLNNYFTVRLDVEELLHMMNKDFLEKAAVMRRSMDSLNKQKALLKAQLAYAETMQLKKQENLPRIKSPLDTGLVIPDLPAYSGNQSIHDSLINLTQLPDLKNTTQLPQLENADSTAARIARLKSNIEALEKQTSLLKKNIDLVEYPDPSKDPEKIFGKPGLNKALKGFKKLEIGMCYPSYSTFMINQLAVKGININYARKSYFTYFTYGKTVSNFSVQPLNNPIQNQIQTINSFFNWDNNSAEKKIIAGKIGFGNENKSYIGLGTLFGRGTASPNSVNVRSNFVFELDGRYTYKFLKLEGAVAKTILLAQYSLPILKELSGNSSAGVYTKSYQLKLSGTLPKIKTKFSQLYRVLEPNFKSYGLGFVRPDILRLETKLEQPIGNRLKLGLNYRRDEDNLKNLHDYKTVLQNVTYSSRIKLFKKRLDLTLTYTDIIQTMRNNLLGDYKRVNSSIKTMVLNYTPKFRRLTSTNTFIFNEFHLLEEAKDSYLQSYSFNTINQYKKVQFNSLNSYNSSNITDSLNFSNSINNTLEFTYSFADKFKVSAGFKHAYSFSLKTSQFGYSGGLNWMIHKLINVEMRFEKLVLGDYLNTLNYNSIHRFPYYGYIKIISNF